MNDSPHQHSFGIYLLTALALVGSLVVGAWIISLADDLQVAEKRKIAYEIADSHGGELQKQLDHSLSAPYAVAAVLRQGNGKIDDFESLATGMLSLYPGISSLQLAPNGVVSQVVPRTGNEPVIGYDLLKDPEGNKAALAAIKSGRLMLAGPFDLIQGGLCVVGHLPVFLPDRNGRERFWGFAGALIRIEDLTSAARVQQLAYQHYQYELSSLMRPDTGQRRILDTSALTGLADPVVYEIEVPDGKWMLAIEPVGGWHSFTFLMIEGAVALVASLLVASMVYSALRRPIILREEVKLRTCELEETGIRLEAEIAERKQVEDELRKLSRATEQSPATVVITDYQGNIEYVNPRFVQVTGYSLEEVKGKNPRILKSGGNPPEVYTHLWETIASGREWRGELLNRKKNGELFWEDERISPVRNEQGRITHFVAVKEDITERKRAEESLRRYNRTLRMLTECNQALIRATQEAELLDNICRDIVDTGGYRMAWVGFAEHDEGKSVRPVAHAGAGKEYLDTLNVTWANTERGQGLTGIAIRSGQTVVAKNIQTDPRYAPWRQVAEKVGIASALSLPLRDGDNTFGALSVYTQDADAFDAAEVELLIEMADDLAYGIVSLRTRENHGLAVDALRESEEKFRSMSESAQDAIVMADHEGNISYWNTAAERIFGYSSPEVMGWNLHALIAPMRYREDSRRALPRFFETGTGPIVGKTRELEALRRDGTEFPIEFSVSAVKIHGKWNAVGVIRDITERKQAEAREAMELAVTRLLAESDTLAETLPKIIQTICETLGWDCGARWSLDREANVLHCVETWSIPSAEITEFLALSCQTTLSAASTRDGLVRRAFSSGAPCWIADVTQDASFLRAPIAAKAGLHGAFAFPILLGDQVLGVSEFFCRAIRQPDEVLIQMIRVIGSQLGQFMGRKQAEQSLHLRDRAIESSSNAIMISDLSLPDNPIIYVNPAFEHITGYSAQEAIGRNGRFLARDDWDQMELEEIRAALREKREGRAVLRCYRKDDSLFWNELSVAPVRDQTGQVTHFISVMNDVTERKRYEEELERQANYDSLTGLPNRNLLGDRLRQGIINAHRNKMEMAVLLVDLDHFKFVNDSMGHSIGDLLLKSVAGRLQSCLREGDTVARLGGDEFALVISVVTREGSYPVVIQRILAEMARPMIIEGREITITCSIGASLYPKDGEEGETLLKNADIAMYRAKEQGCDTFQFYTAEMNAQISERLMLESKLRHALENGELLLHYQPKVSLQSGQIIGAEALIRWAQPELGMISPARFIPLAEETGLIVPIGEWVVRTACAQNKTWQEAGLAPITIAVNLSGRQFRRENLTVLTRILQETKLDPRFLAIELTESMVMQDVDNAIVTLRKLKDIGVGLSIDDFGTGYSSLSYLKRFPIDKLKIDQSFVRDITTDPDDAAITASIIGMAHSLGFGVIAEGVETKEQLAFLRARGCDEMQGYYFSKPLPAENFARLLQEGRTL